MLNGLTQKTFGFDFEGWVTNGYFEGDYIPFSYVEGGIMVSNVSANRMCFRQNEMEMIGKIKIAVKVQGMIF